MTTMTSPRHAVTTVFEVHEVKTKDDLKAWARAHGAQVQYLGSTWQHEEVYGALTGTQVRVCRTPWENHRLHPIAWKSPLETLPVPQQRTP